MAENVIELFPADPSGNPDVLLEQSAGVYESLMLIGWDKDGDLRVRTTAGLGPHDLVFMCESFKHALLSGEFSTGGGVE